MEVSVEQLKKLREKTGAGISDVKKALQESNGDMAAALKIIERKLGGSASKKSARATNAGLVEVYLHSNGRVASMVEVFCETDFVARNPEFKEFAHGLAMHIAAMKPEFVSLKDVSAEDWSKKKIKYEEEVKKMNKPSEIATNIIDGKLKSYFGALTLLNQLFVKEQGKTVEGVLNEAIGKFGENIKIGKFARFEI